MILDLLASGFDAHQQVGNSDAMERHQQRSRLTKEDEKTLFGRFAGVIRPVVPVKRQ